MCERERHDGHDVAHLVRSCGNELDWDRLLARFDEHWEVLLSHLVMYGFAFPSERSKVPDRIMRELLRRTARQLEVGDWKRRVCRGTLVSRTQYQHAVEGLGFEDGRAAMGGAGSATHPDEGRTDGAVVSPGGGSGPSLP